MRAERGRGGEIEKETRTQRQRDKIQKKDRYRRRHGIERHTEKDRAKFRRRDPLSCRRTQTRGNEIDTETDRQADRQTHSIRMI